MCLNPWYKRMHYTGLSAYDWVKLPCGHCVECRKANSYAWRVRLLSELRDSKSAYFVTLTYDEQHYNVAEGVSKKDIQLFLKRLRSFLKVNVRYFIVAEFGDQFQRGHYHGIFFFPKKYYINDLSQIFSKSWKNGNVQFGDVENASIAYVTNYLLKGSERAFDFQTKPFRLMSRRPALGSNLITPDMVNYLNQSTIEPSIFIGGKKFFLPRFYRDRILSDERKDEVKRMYKFLDRNDFGEVDSLDDLRLLEVIKMQKEKFKSKRK